MSKHFGAEFCYHSSLWRAGATKQQRKTEKIEKKSTAGCHTTSWYDLCIQTFLFPPTRDKKTLLRTPITRGTHYMAPSCNGPDVAALPNNVGSGRVGPSHPPPALISSSDVANALALLHAKIALHLMSHAALARAAAGAPVPTELWPWREGLCPAHLASEHHESGSPKLPCELGMGPLFPSPCGCQSCPVLPHATGMWEAITTRR